MKRLVKLTLTLMQASPKNDTDFWVSVPNYGIPDFRIRAADILSARDTLANWLYNELDHREDVDDGCTYDG